MKRSRFTEQQIAFALKQQEPGVAVEEICRKLGISYATIYNRKKKHPGIGSSELRRLKQLEEVRLVHHASGHDHVGPGASLTASQSQP